jgi:peptidyl-prolyl cis-trans isomerase D
MLKSMRDSFHQLKWILLAVVVAFVFGFVFIDMGLGRSVAGRQTDQNFAARVNGDTISTSEYYRALKNYEDMYRQMYGERFTTQAAEQMGIPKQVLDALIDQRLLEQEAARMHLTATPEEVRKKLLSIPTFSPDGKFVGMELYTRYVTGPLGYPSAAAFEEQLGREIALQKMESAMTSSVVVSPQSADAEYRRVNEAAKVKFVVLDAAQQAAKVTVTPAEVEAYYRTNQTKYTHGEQRSFRYLLADYAKLRSQAIPTDAELRRRYEAARDTEYKSPDASHVLHILVKVDPKAPPAVDAAARAKAQSLVAQLRAGADFAALAKANSEDPSSASNGGDMGFVDRGTMVEPFERAIFSLPLNTISDPIRSAEYGYHIVKVLGRRPAGYRSFEEVRPEITARAADEMAKEQARAEINRIYTILKNNKPKDVATFVAYANDKVSSNDSGWFGRNDQIQGIGANPAISQWAFAAKDGEMTQPFGTPRGIAIPYLTGTRPAGVSPLADIRAKVEEDARIDKARALAKTQLASMMAGATSIDQVAAKLGAPARDGNVNRQVGVTGLQGDTSAVVEAALTGNPGTVIGPISTDQGAVALQILEQKKVSPQEIAQNRTSYIENLRSQQARNLRGSLVKRLRDSSKVEVNDQVLQPSNSQSQSQPQQG